MLSNSDIVNFIASDEGHTVEEAASNFGVSVSTIKKRLAKVRNEKDANYDKFLAEKLKLAQAKVTLRGNKKGGSLGKRGRTYSEEEAINLANMYMSGFTIIGLSKVTGIPTSTLWEVIRSINDKELQANINEYILHQEGIVPEESREDVEPWKR